MPIENELNKLIQKFRSHADRQHKVKERQDFSGLPIGEAIGQSAPTGPSQYSIHPHLHRVGYEVLGKVKKNCMRAEQPFQPAKILTRCIERLRG